MDELANPTTGYRFLQWHYEPERRLLSGPDGAVRIKPLLDRLLRRLLDEPGKVLARERLIEEVWTRRQVNDEVLSRAIGELRGLLADDAREPRFVETLPKGGYRWIAPVLLIDSTSPGKSIVAEQSASESGRRRSRSLQIMTASILAAVALIAWLATTRNPEQPAKRAVLAMELLNARPLATDPRLEFDARFDSQGHVVYIRADQNSGASELIQIDPASHAERVLWQDANSLRQPTPSPDAREVAVVRRTDQGCELWAVAVVDEQRTRLGDCAASAVGGLEWIDAGSALLYTGAAVDAAHAPGLMRLDRNSRNKQVVTSPDASEGAHVDPRVSADGSTLVYASTRSGERQLWWTDWPQQRARTALLKRPEPVYGHAFEPGGLAIWAAGDLTQYRALHRLVPGTEPELIGGRGAQSIDLAANGAAVWSEASFDADIWLQRDRDAPRITIGRSNRYESQPEFSTDGKQLALVSNRNGTESVFVVDIGEGSTHALVLNPSLRWVRPTWSARDPSLILTAYENKHTRLYRYQLAGNVLSVISGIEEGAFHGTELADRLLYLNRHESDHSTLMQQRDGQSQCEDLGLGPVSAYRASSDWIAWRSPGSPHLHAAPLPGLQPVQEITRVDEGMVEAFTLSGADLYYVDEGKLWKRSLPSAQSIPVPLDHLPNGSGPNIAVSVDGAIASVTLTSLNMDLMISGSPDETH